MLKRKGLQETSEEEEESEDNDEVEARFGMVKTGAKASYSRLGKELGISKERVRQLANRAFAQLRGLAEELRLETLLA